LNLSEMIRRRKHTNHLYSHYLMAPTLTPFDGPLA
jgi:hypothetical protein